ncbi:hypothetical protein QOZ80_8AG0637080 [Eleusine coracana subsp. coracana]|nr:hypothetical protein QOZ80_8AG0637080 [Eleusine coracana subsp. coracana]
MPPLGTKAGAVPGNGMKPAASSAGGGVGGGGRSDGDMGGDGRKEEKSLGIRCDDSNETKPAASSAGGGGGRSDGDMGGDRCDGSKGTKPAAGRAGGGGGGGHSDGDMSGDGGGERLGIGCEEGPNLDRHEVDGRNLCRDEQRGRNLGGHGEQGGGIERDEARSGRGRGRGRRSPPKIFHGMKIALLGLVPRATSRLKKLISDMGGVAVSPSKYDMSTHLCVQGDTNCRPKIITEEWIRDCCQQNTLLAYDEVCLENERASIQGVKGFSSDEDIKRKLHQLFLCETDMSLDMKNLTHVLAEMKTKVHTVVTPGSSYNHKSATTDDYLKLIVRKIYILLKRLSAAGYTLGGKFSAANFVLDETKGTNIRFAFLEKGILQQACLNGDELDMWSFENMVRREIFTGKEIAPHDLNLWLSLLDEKEIEGLLPSHCLLQSVSRCSESYTTWYDDFVNLETTRSEDYKKIVKNLSQYNGWKAKVNGQDGNGLLQETLDYLDYKTGKPVIYQDTVEDLLRLLRNSRQHSSRYRHSHFALVVGQHFPNLLSDFQGELFKVGCIEPDLE